MYGYPQGKVHHNALARSSDMLEFLISHMTQVASGPRYLCGDLNHEIDQLPALQRLVQLGWREAQDLECLRTGTQPQTNLQGMHPQGHALDFTRVGSVLSVCLCRS